MLLVCVLFLLASSMRIVSGADWCYQSQVTCDTTCAGPDLWGNVSQQCSGRFQSPINIVTKKAMLDERLNEFEVSGFQETFHGQLINNGHSVQLELPSSIKVKEGGLPASYKALQLHLHWGKDGGPGSEHTIDGEQFPMEMHIVLIKEEHDSLAQAETDPTGVAVLGFFFQESTSANKKFDPLINAVKNITQPTNSTTLSGVSLEMFTLPRNDMEKYYRYSGSLTTPNCTEVVIWSLFEKPISLSRTQLAAFSELQFADGNQMVNTFRPVQPLNGRQVYYSSGHVVLVSTVLLVTSVLVSSGFTLHNKG